MKINKHNVSSTGYTSAVNSAYGKKQKVTEVERSGDSVDLSESTGLYNKAMETLAQVPDIRTEAVSGIQDEFANGTYQRDDTEVAEKVIEDYLDT